MTTVRRKTSAGFLERRSPRRKLLDPLWRSLTRKAFSGVSADLIAIDPLFSSGAELPSDFEQSFP
jgi:hypothetical protein